MSATLDHVTIVAEDFEASRAVYDALLGCLGVVPGVEYEDPEGDEDDTGTVAAVGYSDAAGRLLLWLVAGRAGTTGAHLALAVTEPALIQAVHATARDAGIPVVQAPRDWESNQLHYYGTQLSDPAGNRVEVLLRHPAGAEQRP
ncbi:VOC family protein [Jatrophihabitans sp.]|uniref:VOC family protein n=1 Tax=Jatrophihabitans sp. TaxID=1932789 RepID=UPI002EFCE781